VTGHETPIVDSHAHLTSREFDPDRAEVIARAREADVTNIVTIGTGLESGREATTLAEADPGILAVVGFHPHSADSVTREDVAALRELARHPRVVAVGEIGLDFYREYSSRDGQHQVLVWQLDLAAGLGLPVVIHCREAHQEMLPVLQQWSTGLDTAVRSPGIIHCFMGDTETARQYLDMGFYLSLAAYIGYPSSRYAHGTIRSIPPDRLLVETDCPYLAPQSRRGKRNEPAYVRETVARLADIRGVPFADVVRQTTENAGRVFGWQGDSA